jgi:hypothetical protein
MTELYIPRNLRRLGGPRGYDDVVTELQKTIDYWNSGLTVPQKIPVFIHLLKILDTFQGRLALKRNEKLYQVTSLAIQRLYKEVYEAGYRLYPQEMLYNKVLKYLASISHIVKQ